MRSSSLFARLVALVRARRLDRELDDEIRAHLELAEYEARARGASAEEARRLARRHFGGIDRMREEHRDRRSVRWIEHVLRDFRHGLAGLWRQKTFAAITVSVLALGIGANAAMFGVMDAVLLKPLPFPAPERIVRIWEAPRTGAVNSTTTPDYLAWQRMATSFAAMAAEVPAAVALTGIGDPVRLRGKAVTAGYFTVFGTQPAIGRGFAPGDDEVGAPATVVLSHAAWQTTFGGERAIIGRDLMLDGRPHQVIGVLPPGPFDREGAVYMPLALPSGGSPENHWLTVHGRLRDGVTIERARAQMTAIDAGLAGVQPLFKRAWVIVVEPLTALLVGDRLTRTILIAFGAAALVLLIACANVANLLLARGAARGRELAVRAALGASRGRLVAQLLTESLALCVLGGLAGIAVAVATIRAAAPFLVTSLPYTSEVRLDLRALAFTAAIVLGVTLLVGALPALQGRRGRVSPVLGGSARGTPVGHARIRRTLVVAEVALSLVLLCGAVLLTKSLLNLQRLDTGVRAEGIVTFSLDLPENTYPTPEHAALFYERLTEAVGAVPGVEAAALATHLPLQWVGQGEGLQLAGRTDFINVRYKRVDPGYFAALGIPVIAGRGLTERDRAATPAVAVVNQALAARLQEASPATNPVGLGVRITTPQYAKREGALSPVQIVGVIRSERVGAPWRPDPNVVYIPMAQAPAASLRLVVRTATAPGAVVAAVRAALRRIAPTLAFGEIATMGDVRDETFAIASRPAWVVGAFAAVGAVLSALGLYGVLSHLVAQRRREIGIRMALGARAGAVVSAVLRDGLLLVALGLGLGLAGTVLLSRVLRTMLFEVSPLDPVALLVACGAMLATGLLAGLLPARRAAGVDPVVVLRAE